MDFLVYYTFVVSGTLLILVATFGLAFHSGPLVSFGVIVALAVTFLVAIHTIDVGIAPGSEKRRKVEGDRRVQRAIDAARLIEWGQSPDILSIHHDNPRYPYRVEISESQYERISLLETRAIHLWCVENEIVVRRFLWSATADEYSARIKTIFDRTDFGASPHPFKEIDEIRHMAPKPFLAFSSEHDALAFKMRWL